MSHPSQDIVIAEPPTYRTVTPLRMITQCADGSVVVVPIHVLGEARRDAHNIFPQLQRQFSNASIVLAVPPDIDPLSLALIDAIPNWQCQPIVSTDPGTVGQASIRQALNDTSRFDEQVVQWVLAIAPRAVRLRPVIHQLMTAAPRNLAEVLHDTGYTSRTAARKFAAVDLPHPREMRSLAVGARIALALQHEDRPSAERVALRYGYESGSAVSHLLINKFCTNVNEVRQTLGWTWLASRRFRFAKRYKTAKGTAGNGLRH